MLATENEKEEKILPRDMLLAKAKAYREKQVNAPVSHPQEQLSLNVNSEGEGPESSRKLSQDVVRSPFSKEENLDVPAYIRRKQLNEHGQNGID